MKQYKAALKRFELIEKNTPTSDLITRWLIFLRKRESESRSMNGNDWPKSEKKRKKRR